MRYGYARHPSICLPLMDEMETLYEAGCQGISYDVGLSEDDLGPNFMALVSRVRHGDSIVVYRLQSLCTTYTELVAICGRFADKQIELTSLSDEVEGGHLSGKLFLHLMKEIDQDSGSLTARIQYEK